MIGLMYGLWTVANSEDGLLTQAMAKVKSSEFVPYYFCGGSLIRPTGIHFDVNFFKTLVHTNSISRKCNIKRGHASVWLPSEIFVLEPKAITCQLWHFPLVF